MNIFEKINTFGSNKYVINKCIENQSYKEKIFNYYKISNQNILYDENFNFCQIEKDILDGYYIDPEELANDICNLASFEWISFKINQLSPNNNANTNSNTNNTSTNGGGINYSPGYYTPDTPVNEETNNSVCNLSSGIWCIDYIKNLNNSICKLSSGIWCIDYIKNLNNSICKLSSGIWCNEYINNL